MSKSALCLFAASAILTAARPAAADSFGLGTAADYAILSYGGATVSMSGGGVYDPITGLTGGYVVGDIGIGDKGKFSQSAGAVQGTVFLGTGATINISGVSSSVINNGLPVAGGGGSSISGGIRQTAAIDAAIDVALQTATGRSAFYAGLTAGCVVASTCASYTSYSSLSGNQTITGAAGLNIINVAGNLTMNNQMLTLFGSSSSLFVFNVGGDITMNGGVTQTINGKTVKVAETLTGGVSASNVLFNQYGSGNKVSFTSNALAYGTFLNPKGNIGVGDAITLSGGEVIGELIGGSITLASSSQVVHPTPPTDVPEPATLLLFAPALALAVRRRRAL